MTSKKSIFWLGRTNEKEALKLSTNHIKEIVNTIDTMKETVSLFCEDRKNIREKAKKVLDKERKADEIKRDILEELSKGKFPPANRENIIRLILSSDDIADNGRAAALKISFLNPDNVRTDLKDKLKNLSKLAYESTILLEDAFSAMFENPEKVREKAAEVERMEEEVDSFRAESLTPNLVDWANDCKLTGTSYVLAEVENNIENVVDGTEDSADVLREIAIESM